jgi:hypothetical protein
MKGGIVSGANAAGDNEFLIYLDMQGSEPIIEVMLKGESGIFKVKGFVNLKEWNLITLQRKENKVWLYSGQSNNLIGEFTFSEKAKGSLKVDSLIIGQEQDLNKAGQKEVGILGNVKFTVDKNQAFKGMLDEVKFNTGLSKAVSGAQKELEMCSVAGDEDQDGKSDCDDEDCFENTKCVPPIKLLAQYDFETLEKAGTSDHKIVKDSIEPYSDGKAFSAIGQLLLKDGSKAGEFPGDTSSYVEIPPEVASAMKVFSITFWFRTVKGGTIIASENDQLKIYLEQVFDRGSDDLKITLGGKELVYQMDNSEGGVFDGEWHSLTVTRNRRFVKAYVDAKELLPAEKDQAKNIVNDDELQLKNLILGQGLKSGYFMKDKAFSGTLDTLKFYQGILHITSINMNQAKTKPVEPEIKEGESSGTETGKTESDCTDGKDEDQDGKVDCLDSDCYGKKGPKGLICCYSGTDDPEEDGKACSYEKAWCDTEGVTGSYQCYQCLPGEWECDDTGNKGMTCQEGKCAAELSPDLTGSGIDKDGDGVLDEYEPPECINPSFISVYKVYDEKNKGISSSYSSSNKDFIKVFAGCLKGDIGGGEKSSPNLKVDESDFAPFIGQYLLGKEGKMSKVSRGDVNQDGKVDESDFAPFIGEYLKNKEKK